MASSYSFWPEWMPAPQQDSFSIQPEDRRLTSETEAGSIVRYQFDTDINVADCTIVLNRSQAAWFERFERDMLKQGTVWFKFPLWVGGKISEELCRFKTRPKAGSLIGLHTTYSFSLYVSNRSLTDYNDCLMKLFMCWPPCFFPKADKLVIQSFLPLSKISSDAITNAVGNDSIFESIFAVIQSITNESVENALTLNG